MTSFSEMPGRNDILQPVRQWLDSIKIHNAKLAHWLCKAIRTMSF